MSSTSEKGHAKNVANLKTLTTYLTSLQPNYNPTKTAITVASLQTLFTGCTSSMDGIKIAQPPYAAAVDAQELAFKPLSKLVTRVLNSYATVVEDKQELQTAISLKNKITGTGPKPKKPENPDADTVSGSKLSYDNRIDNLFALIKVLENNSNYKPNETDLQTGSLTTYANELKTKTEAVDAVSTPIINGRIVRNNILYADKTGFIPETINDVKSYIISVFGANSPQIKYINTLKFKRII